MEYSLKVFKNPKAKVWVCRVESRKIRLDGSKGHWYFERNMTKFVHSRQAAEAYKMKFKAFKKLLKEFDLRDVDQQIRFANALKKY